MIKLQKQLVILIAIILTAIPAQGVEAKSGGGGGVGNIILASLPGSDVQFQYPSEWKSQQDTQKLVMMDDGGSSVVAQRLEIAEVTEPRIDEINRVLSEKYPDRRYYQVQVNEFKGLRADIAKTGGVKDSDLVLVSPEKETYRVTAHLTANQNGIKSGEKIISSMRLKYRGVPFKNGADKSATLKKLSYFDLMCSVKHCDHEGVHIQFGNGPGNHLQVGTAGYDSGRILDLGEVSYQDVRIDGEYLVSPVTKTKLTEIYSEFTSKSPYTERDSIALVEKHVYLIRTISWPDEDMIFKVYVNTLAGDNFVSFTYQPLTYVPPEILQGLVTAMNERTKAVEMPQDHGVVTLYARGLWGDYQSSSFNFRYSTRDNFYISGNRKDLAFNGQDQALSFPGTWASRGGITDFGEMKPLNTLSLNNFPDPMNPGSADGVKAQVGHTYLIESLDDSYFAFAAVKVLEMEPQGKWIRLEWKRMAVVPPYHFQKWTPVSLMAKSACAGEVTLINSNTESSYFSIAQCDRKDKPKKPLFFSQDLGAGGESFSVDNRYYPNETGIAELSQGTSVSGVTLESIEALSKSKAFSSFLSIQEGRVYVLLLENMWEKSAMVFQVEKYVPEKSVTFSYRVLFEGQTNPGLFIRP